MPKTQRAYLWASELSRSFKWLCHWVCEFDLGLRIFTGVSGKDAILALNMGTCHQPLEGWSLLSWAHQCRMCCILLQAITNVSKA